MPSATPTTLTATSQRVIVMVGTTVRTVNGTVWRQRPETVMKRQLSPSPRRLVNISDLATYDERSFPPSPASTLVTVTPARSRARGASRSIATTHTNPPREPESPALRPPRLGSPPYDSRNVKAQFWSQATTHYVNSNCG